MVTAGIFGTLGAVIKGTALEKRSFETHPTCSRRKQTQEIFMLQCFAFDWLNRPTVSPGRSLSLFLSPFLSLSLSSFFARQNGETGQD